MTFKKGLTIPRGWDFGKGFKSLKSLGGSDLFWKIKQIEAEFFCWTVFLSLMIVKDKLAQLLTQVAYFLMYHFQDINKSLSLKETVE